MANHPVPTAGAAIGAVTREWNRLVRLAIRIREHPNSDEARNKRGEFTGIFRRLLTDPIEELRAMLPDRRGPERKKEEKFSA